MNENIDLTKILKDCPRGWEFYSSIYGNVTFLRIENDTRYRIAFSFIYEDKSEGYGNVTEQGLYDVRFDILPPLKRVGFLDASV